MLVSRLECAHSLYLLYLLYLVYMEVCRYRLRASPAGLALHSGPVLLPTTPTKLQRPLTTAQLDRRYIPRPNPVPTQPTPPTAQYDNASPHALAGWSCATLNTQPHTSPPAGVNSTLSSYFFPFRPSHLFPSSSSSSSICLCRALFSLLLLLLVLSVSAPVRLLGLVLGLQRQPPPQIASYQPD